MKTLNWKLILSVQERQDGTEKLSTAALRLNLFWGLATTEHLRHTCTRTMHRVLQPICQGGRQGFKNSLIAEWLRWLHGWNVDIFVAINHQAQSGCIQEQPRHPSTPLLLSASPPSISSVMKPSILGFPSASIFPLQVSLFIAHLVKHHFKWS